MCIHFIAKAILAINKHTINTIFIATDNNIALNIFKNSLHNENINIIYLPEISRETTNLKTNKGHHHRINVTGLNKSNDRKYHNYYLIRNRSSISDVAIIMSDTIKETI